MVIFSHMRYVKLIIPNRLFTKLVVFLPTPRKQSWMLGMGIIVSRFMNMTDNVYINNS